jgi:hypothetical protein
MGNLINQLGTGLGAGAQSAINQQIGLQNLQEQIAGKLQGQIGALEGLDPNQRALGLALSGVKQGAPTSLQDMLLMSLLAQQGIQLPAMNQQTMQFPNLFGAGAGAVPGSTPGIVPNDKKQDKPRKRIDPGGILDVMRGG